ncbi:MAG: hypothetical protein AAFP98_11515 [Pseudomonadota bacterium]
MTYQSPLSQSAPRPVSTVTVLRCRDQFDLDPAPVLAFAETHTCTQAEDMICRALEDIATRLDRLQAARAATAFEQMDSPARRIAVIAGGLGLIDVARASAHLRVAADTGNAVAVAATLARLERSFDAGISAIWSVQHPSG